MESHLQHTHGRHFDDQDTVAAVAGAGHHTGHDFDGEEHHGEKKSVIKKVKAKAKKLKDTIIKHGHGHDHDHHHHDDDEEDDDDDEETVEDPEVHGAPMYDSAAVTGRLGGPDVISGQTRGNLERPSVMAEDRYVAGPVGRHGGAPPVSTGAYGTDLSEPSGLGVNPEQWRGKIGHSTGMEEYPLAPKPSSVTQGTTHVPDPVGGYGRDVNQEESRGKFGKLTGMVEDPNAPKDPSRVLSDRSNYETKVTNPTRTGGKEAEVSQIQDSFNKMGIDEPKSFDPTHPENMTGNPSGLSGGYTEKISSAASAVADKAAAAKDVIASKLGYSGQNPSVEPTTEQAPATGYTSKVAGTVAGTLAPVYEKVVDTGSSVVAKVKETVSGTGAERPEGEGAADKGVSVNKYLSETLRPRDEDKALSEVITHAFQRGKEGEADRKSGEDRRQPVGTVTESVEVRRRLGEDHGRHSGEVSAEKSVTERLSNAFGSWFGAKGNTPEGSLGTTYVTDEGLSSSPGGDRK